MRSPVCSLLCLAASLGAQTFTFRPIAPGQGQVLKIRAGGEVAEARLNNRTISLFPQEDGRSLGLMPIPVLEKPGAYKLEFLDKTGAVIHTSSLTILNAHYPRQNIAIA